jgi:hypothetical protein
MGLLICLFAIYVFVGFKPYRRPEDNNLGVVLAFSLTLIFMCALIIKVGAVAELSSSFQQLFGYFLIGSLFAGPLSAIPFGMISGQVLKIAKVTYQVVTRLLAAKKAVTAAKKALDERKKGKEEKKAEEVSGEVADTLAKDKKTGVADGAAGVPGGPAVAAAGLAAAGMGLAVKGRKDDGQGAPNSPSSAGASGNHDYGDFDDCSDSDDSSDDEEASGSEQSTSSSDASSSADDSDDMGAAGQKLKAAAAKGGLRVDKTVSEGGETKDELADAAEVEESALAFPKPVANLSAKAFSKVATKANLALRPPSAHALLALPPDLTLSALLEAAGLRSFRRDFEDYGVETVRGGGWARIE